MRYGLVSVGMPAFTKCEPVRVLKPVRPIPSLSEQSKTGDKKTTSESLFLVLNMTALVRAMLAAIPNHLQNFSSLTE